MDSSARFILSNADLGNTPTIVLVIYLIILFGLGVLGYIKSKGTEEDYYLAGRGQGLCVYLGFCKLGSMFLLALLVFSIGF